MWERIKDFFHLHEWIITEAVYTSDTQKKLGLYNRPELRRCRQCGAVDILMVHCLGLNPPKYIVRWETANPSDYPE